MLCIDYKNYIKHIFPSGKHHKLLYRHMTFKDPGPFWQIYKPIGCGIWILTGPWLYEWCPWTESVNRSCLTLTHTHTVNRRRSTRMRLGLDHINQNQAYKQVPWCNTSKPQGMTVCVCVARDYAQRQRVYGVKEWNKEAELTHMNDMWQSYIFTTIQPSYPHNGKRYRQQTSSIAANANNPG